MKQGLQTSGQVPLFCVCQASTSARGSYFHLQVKLAPEVETREDNEEEGLFLCVKC